MSADRAVRFESAMKRCVVSFIAVTCALLCWAMCVLLIIDHPFSARLSPRTLVYYSGGRIVGEYRSHETLIGPTEVIGHRGDDPYYVNFSEIQAWRQSLPAPTSQGALGVHWFQRFAERERTARAWRRRCTRSRSTPSTCWRLSRSSARLR